MGRQSPVAWPQDATQRREFEGRLEPLAKVYKAHGLNMLPSHATFPDGSNSTELGILQMQERFASARLKGFASCTEWFEEYRQYYRRDGQLVKVRDDLMSATRVGVWHCATPAPCCLTLTAPTRVRATKRRWHAMLKYRFGIEEAGNGPSRDQWAPVTVWSNDNEQ